MAEKFEKPLHMKDLFLNQIKRQLKIASGLTILSGVAYYYFVCLHRKRVYRDFHANYNIYQTFEDIRATGVFQSCPPD